MKRVVDYIIKDTTWGDFVKGAMVRVTGERGQFKFLAHCANIDTGSEWVDVYGGPAGHETMRSFRLERVKLIPARTRRGRANAA